MILKHCAYHITYKCNLSCHGCVNYSNHLNAHKLPPIDNWLTELEKLSDRFTVKWLEILGGEPLMHPNIKDIVEYCANQSKFEIVTLVTNGLPLADNTWLKPYIDSGKITLNISYHHSPLVDTKYTEMLNHSIAQFTGLTAKHIKKVASRLYYNDKENIGIPGAPNCDLSMKVSNKENDPVWKYPTMDNMELPIQYDNDPDKAFEECLCPFVHYVGGELHKCSVTGTFRQVLKLHNKLDEWPLLRDYTGYDLFVEHNQEDFNRLFVTEDVCKYCPVGDQWQYEKKDLHSKIIHITDV